MHLEHGTVHLNPTRKYKYDGNWEILSELDLSLRRSVVYKKFSSTHLLFTFGVVNITLWNMICKKSSGLVRAEDRGWSPTVLIGRTNTELRSYHNWNTSLHHAQYRDMLVRSSIRLNKVKSPISPIEQHEDRTLKPW